MNKTIKRIGCGASDCIYNKHFRCTCESIEVDETSMCKTIQRVIKDCDNCKHDGEPCGYPGDICFDCLAADSIHTYWEYYGGAS